MRRTRAVLGLFVPLTLAFASCGGDDGSARGGGSGSGAAELEDVVALEGDEVAVDVIDNTFRDENIKVGAGTTVVWENLGRQDHDIVPNGGNGWGVGPEAFTPGEVYEHTFDQPGTYRYYCSLHGDEEAGMIGAVVVE